MDIFFNNKVDWIENVEVLANIQLSTLLYLPFTLLLELLKEDKLNLLITPPPFTPRPYLSTLDRELLIFN